MQTLISKRQSRSIKFFTSKLTAPIKHVPVFLNAITIIILIFAFTATLAQKQTRDYTYIIKKGSDSIGKLKTRQSIDGIKTINAIESKVEFNLLVDFVINETCTDVYYNSKLNNALTVRTINGREKVRNTILKTNDGYHLKKKEEADINFSGSISHSISSLYFDEPDNYNIVFSEIFQQNIQLKKVESHKYLIETPNGNKTYYSYSNGILVNVKVETDWTTLTMELENPLAYK